MEGPAEIGRPTRAATVIPHTHFSPSLIITHFQENAAGAVEFGLLQRRLRTARRRLRAASCE